MELPDLNDRLRLSAELKALREYLKSKPRHAMVEVSEEKA